MLYLSLAAFPVSAMLGIAFDADATPRIPVVALCGGITGYLVGRLQARWLWAGTMPRRMWAPWSALGWAAGSVLLALASTWIGGLGENVGAESRALFSQIAFLVCGGVAGALSGVQQARVLRWRDLDSSWWIGVSAGATALAWFTWVLAGYSRLG
jgi:hypothetical protein